MNSNDTLQNYKVGFGEKVAFGVGGLAINFVWASIGLFIVYFYTDVVGISPGVVGILMLVSRIWYGVSDVIMGVIVDRTDTKYGKARPWILYLAIPFGISTILLFTIPQNFSDVLKIVYIFITYNLMVIMFTGVVIPYGTLTKKEIQWLFSPNEKSTSATVISKVKRSRLYMTTPPPNAQGSCSDCA